MAADEEALPFRDASLDLVVSALALQFVNDLPGALVQIRRALKPDGLFLAALIGGETLTELRQAFAAAESDIEGGVSPHVAPFADLRDLGALLQRAGFALPVTDTDRLVVRYDTVFGLMHDLRRMGATNALLDRRRTPLRRATLMRMAEIYAQRFADADGRVRATFEIVWLSGWAPHPRQQQPLKPGSASTHLPTLSARTKSRPVKRLAVNADFAGAHEAATALQSPTPPENESHRPPSFPPRGKDRACASSARRSLNTGTRCPRRYFGVRAIANPAP